MSLTTIQPQLNGGKRPLSRLRRGLRRHDQTPRIAELEGLRGLLALWVVVVHALPIAGWMPQQFGFLEPLFGGWLRVKVFCIMSGFVIFIMLHARKPDYASYIGGRVRRLYPVYLVALLISIAMSPVTYQALLTPDYPNAVNDGRFQVLEASWAMWPQQLLAHLTLTHGLVPASLLPKVESAFLGQAWNISTEMQFYIIAPLLVWGFTRKRPWQIALSVLIVLGLTFVLRDYPNFAALPHFMPFFLVGIASFYIWRYDWSELTVLRWLGWPMLVAATVGSAYVSLSIGLWVLVFGSALLSRDFHPEWRPIGRLLGSASMTWLGGISYPLYLIHMVPLFFLAYGMNGRGLSQPVYTFLLLVLGIALSILSAWALTVWVERPFYRSRSRQQAVAVRTES